MLDLPAASNLACRQVKNEVEFTLTKAQSHFPGREFCNKFPMLYWEFMTFRRIAWMQYQTNLSLSRPVESITAAP
jgi:hypothetical protein